MFTNSPILIIFVVVALTLVLNALRIMGLITLLTGGRARTPTATSLADSHLSFDERVAERMRELAKQQDSGRAGPPMTQVSQKPGFGRRID